MVVVVDHCLPFEVNFPGPAVVPQFARYTKTREPCIRDYCIPMKNCLNAEEVSVGPHGVPNPDSRDTDRFRIDVRFSTGGDLCPLGRFGHMDFDIDGKSLLGFAFNLAQAWLKAVLSD